MLPEVFDRFQEAAAKPTEAKRGLDALLAAESLQGLPAVFLTLQLLRDEKGTPAFRIENGPLREVFDRIDDRANYGDTASGRYLAEEFLKEPFGWEFEVVRLLVLSLLRAGRIEATSKGQTFDAVTALGVRETFSNNNLFRQATFRPKKGLEPEERYKAAQAFEDTFGREVRDIYGVASELRQAVSDRQDTVESALSLLKTARLPGGAFLERALGEMKAIVRGSDDNAIGTFNAGHRAIKEAIRRAAELEQTLTEPRLHDLERARRAIEVAWPVLQQESDLSPELASRAPQLADLLERETFYRDLPAIEQHARAIELEYARRFDDAQQARRDTYNKAYEQLTRTTGWRDLPPETQSTVDRKSVV